MNSEEQKYVTEGYIHSEKDLRAKYGAKSVSEKCLYILTSFFLELWWLLKRVFKIIFYKPSILYLQPFETPVWNPNSDGLYLFIHGLRLHAFEWEEHLKCLEGQMDKVDVLMPKVVKKGDCSLEAAGKPILKIIMNYINSHPNKPICILGMSNGCRIALWLEYQLRQKAPQVAVKVSATSGVLFGTRLVNFLRKFAILRIFVGCPTICDELAFGSETARKLLDRVKEPFDQDKRDYEFYTTTEDFELIDLCTALPRLDKGERYHVVPGRGHHSILPVICQKQMQDCQDWMAKQIRAME